ncbi:Domain of uncharacterised function (DUF1840) (plasmid) [Legionella adelaidensis]|uniref:Domain of uncharacterized function (DUF1840) n=1 Tax=Legionella adelaidensis TaxID=45056 RepID=A0A0W0R369_9GAMM|nr:DUF1840 domain-containing protein [Legionella adelaidensis]KTC65483.1 hypothetical protein Lade_0141 [Legionella adelaidensis]VEH84696.1 Domain of uncharacterised function (DUF1840) [Legionella adelaidensis]
MLVTFSTEAHENITMFGDIALRLIKMMGHSGTIPSAILAEDVPDALERLQNAVSMNPNPSQGEQDKENGEAPISLRNRAFPLIELLKAAAKKKCNVMWKAN